MAAVNRNLNPNISDNTMKTLRGGTLGQLEMDDNDATIFENIVNNFGDGTKILQTDYPFNNDEDEDVDEEIGDIEEETNGSVPFVNNIEKTVDYKNCAQISITLIRKAQSLHVVSQAADDGLIGGLLGASPNGDEVTCTLATLSPKSVLELGLQSWVLEFIGFLNHKSVLELDSYSFNYQVLKYLPIQYQYFW
eukprot:UN01297